MRRHFFICTNRRAPDAGLQCCAPNGGQDGAAALRAARAEHRLVADVFITETMCLGPCPEQGSSVVVYPEGTWYTGVTFDDVPELVDKHMLRGEVVERLLDRAWSEG